MTRERASLIADMICDLIDQRGPCDARDRHKLFELFATEADDPKQPEKPAEPVYRTAEYLAAALVVRACPPEQASEGARLFDDFLAMLRRYKPEAK